VSGNATDLIDGTDNPQNVVTAATPTIYWVKQRSLNAIHNPNFEIDQRRCGGSAVYKNASAMQVDRWGVYTNAATGQVTAQQVNGNLVNSDGNYITSKYLSLTLNTQQATLAASEALRVAINVEGPQLRPLISNVHSLSILAYCSQAISFSVSLNGGSTVYSYLSPLLSLPANTWTILSLPNLPIFPSAAGWNILAGASGYVLRICLGAGSSVSGSPGWVTGQIFGTTGTTNFFSLPVNTVFNLGFVQHEPGPYCSSFIPISFQDNLLACQRYFAKSNAYGALSPTNGDWVEIGNAYVSSAIVRTSVKWPVEMALNPTVTVYDNTGLANKVFPDSVGSVAISSVQVIDTAGFGVIQLAAAVSAACQGVLGQWRADTGW
jgi:hypothetical protein